MCKREKRPKLWVDPFDVVRNGIVAAKLRNKRLFVDAFTFPGNSGGPVFWKPAVGLNFGTPKIEGRKPCLIGIVSNYKVYSEHAMSPATGRPRIVFESNSGLTEVVPTERILETFEYPAMKAAIARWDKT